MPALAQSARTRTSLVRTEVNKGNAEYSINQVSKKRYTRKSAKKIFSSWQLICKNTITISFTICQRMTNGKILPARIDNVTKYHCYRFYYEIPCAQTAKSIIWSILYVSSKFVEKLIGKQNQLYQSLFGSQVKTALVIHQKKKKSMQCELPAELSQI